MLNFEDLKQASKKNEKALDKKHKACDDLMKSIAQDLSDFSKTKQKDKITSAADKLLEYNKLKSTDVRAYLFLAYIAFVFDDIKLTQQYLSTATAIDPNYQPLKDFKIKLSKF